MFRLPEDPYGDRGPLKFVAIGVLLAMIIITGATNVIYSKEPEFHTVVFQGPDSYFACENIPISVNDDSSITSLGIEISDARCTEEDGVYIISTEEHYKEISAALAASAYTYSEKVGVY